jgi:YVTN family beta-propeller protein
MSPRSWSYVFGLLVLAAVVGASGTREYRVVANHTLGGEGGWDCLALDPGSNRLFITRGNHVMVVDRSDGRVIGDIPGLDHAHDVAFDVAAGRGFATSGGDSSVVMFDLRTLQPLGRIPVDVDADIILFDPATRRVFSMNADAGTMSVIDPVAGTRIGTVALGANPEFGVADGQGHLYVNLASSSELAEIDAAGMTVTRRWSLAPGESPTGLAMDTRHHVLFSACRNQVMVISDAVAGRVITTVPIGRGADGCEFDAGRGLAFASTGDGVITVVQEDSPTRFHVAESPRTAPGARTMTLDPHTHTLYTVTSQFGPQPADSVNGRPRRPPMIPGTFALYTLRRE